MLVAVQVTWTSGGHQLWIRRFSCDKMDCMPARKGVRRGISRVPVRGGHAGANLHEQLLRFLDGTSKLRHSHVRCSVPKLARLIVNS